MGVSLTHCYKRICVLLLVFFSASHYALASDEARSGKHKYPDDLVNVVPGENFTAAIDEDGELWLWGDFSALGLSNSVITYRNKKGNIRFSQLRNDSRGRDIVDDISAIALGKEHILMLKTNGSLWSVGKNTFGQLGTGDNQNQEFPVEIDLALFAIPAIKQIVSGVYHNVIVAGDDNLVYAWGSNANGQLGNAGSQNVNSPTAVVDSDGNQLNQVTQISTKGEHNLAIRGIDNNLWVWGKNLDGELGLGHNENTFVATQVMIDEVVQAPVLDTPVSMNPALYTIDFEDRTTNIVGQRPPTGLGVIPRTTVSRIMFGAPSIQPSSIDGLGQALLFAPSGTSYDQVFLETADLAAATQYCFESDILVHNILGSNNGFTVLFDTPQVRRIDFNQNGSIDKFVPFVAGSSTSGVFGFNEVFTLQVSIDLSSDTWTIYQNGNNISSGGFGGATELRSIRLSSGSLSGVIDVRTEVDNIVLRSGELCHTQLPPPPPVIVQVPVNNISKVSASPSQSIALTLDGEVQVWGNTASFVGLETNYTRPTTLDLTQLASPIEVTSVLAGTGSYHLISTKGSIHSWGANVLGALANAGALTASSSLVTAVASDQTEVQNVEAIFENSSSFIAKVADDEDFVVWGNNASNQLGVLAQSVIFSPIELFED